jgi:hypothetical protein
MGFLPPYNREPLLQMDLPLRGSRTHNGRERACAFICRGWTVGGCTLSLKRSPKPTPRTICSSYSMVLLGVIAQKR